MGITEMSPIAFRTTGHGVNNIYQLNVGRFQADEKSKHDTINHSKWINCRKHIGERNQTPIFFQQLHIQVPGAFLAIAIENTVLSFSRNKYFHSSTKEDAYNFKIISAHEFSSFIATH